MKPFLLCSFLLGASAVAQAQAPVGSRALSKADINGAPWPRFARDPGAVRQPDYVAIQFLLRNQGFFKTKPDGIFGSGTARAVKALQRAKGLLVDGVVGPQTWVKLCPRLKRGDRGDAVRALQTLLNYQNESTSAVKVDGIFGFSTEKALRTYQANVQMYEDGVAGAQMWAYLFSPTEGDH